MTDEEKDTKERFDRLIAMGLSPWVAEGLSERGWDYVDGHWYQVIGGYNELREPSGRELLDEVLEWHGIIGFTSKIMTAVEQLI